MSGKATLKGLLAHLAQGRIVPMPRPAWESIAEQWPPVATVATGMAGSILLLQQPGSGWAIVEEPKPDERVVRPLASEAEARALIADRLAAYERMWDG